MYDRDLHELLDILPVSIRVFDSSGALTRRNKLAEAADGAANLRSIEDFWRRDKAVFAETGLAVTLQEWAGTLALKGEVVRLQKVILTGRDNSEVLLSAIPYRDSSGNIITVVIVEAASSAPLFNSATNTAHAINNALNPIVQGAWLLERNANNPAAVREYAVRMKEAAEAAAALVAGAVRIPQQGLSQHEKVESNRLDPPQSQLSSNDDDASRVVGVESDVTSAISAGNDVQSEVSSSLRVLVVEDHDEGRRFIYRLLTAEGYSVDTVAGFEEACAAMRGAHVYDVMVTDVELPDGDGWSLVAFAKESFPNLRVGVITGFYDASRNPRRYTPDFLLLKPLQASELLSQMVTDGDNGRGVK